MLKLFYDYEKRLVGTQRICFIAFTAGHIHTRMLMLIHTRYVHVLVLHHFDCIYKNIYWQVDGPIWNKIANFIYILFFDWEHSGVSTRVRK